MRRRSLPQLVIPIPCHVDWNAMTRIDRDGRARFCDRCAQPVYDSQAMTRAELGDLIARCEGRRLPCVRLHRRPDGTIVTRSCFAPVLRAGRFLWLKVALGAVAFWAGALGLRPLALSVNRYREARETELAMADRTSGMLGAPFVVVPPPSGLARLAPLPPAVVPPRPMPSPVVRPLLHEVERAAPLRYLEADEDIKKRVEPDPSPGSSMLLPLP
jgi:hypothetical protein